MKTIHKTTLLLLFFVFSFGTVRAFEPDRMIPEDRLIVSLFTDIWQDTPDDMDLKTIQRGINISILQDMPIGRSNFSVAAGLGFTSHNIYSDHLYQYNYVDERFDFTPIHDELSYDNNKLSLNYLEVPVQIRLRTRDRNQNFRAYAGIMAGWLVNAHTKFEGQAFTEQHQDNSSSTRTIKVKTHKLRNIANYRIGLTGTFGYGRVNLFVYYPLTDLFSDNNARDMYPISLGLSFIIF